MLDMPKISEMEDSTSETQGRNSSCTLDRSDFCVTTGIL